MKKKNEKSGPTQILASEIAVLRQELRATLRAYSARLEITLAESANKIGAYESVEKLPRELVQEIRDITILLRKRKLRPEKGRRKDLRKIDSLIDDLHSVTHPGTSH
jgi:hypothetical protein